MTTLFQIQTVFHKFNLNNDVQQIIFFKIFSYYQNFIKKKWNFYFINKNLLIFRMSCYNLINQVGYVFYNVFDKNIAIDFYRASKIINNKSDIQNFYPYFIYLRDFYIFQKRPWNKINYDTNNTFYKMCKKSLKIFYKKYCNLIIK